MAEGYRSNICQVLVRALVESSILSLSLSSPSYICTFVHVSVWDVWALLWQAKFCKHRAQADQIDLRLKPYTVIPTVLQPKEPMAVLRIVSLCMLLCCSEAMLKKDMRTVGAA